ncbi:MAG: TetR/AcrR family transcriptional regulator [Nocardioides sp.]|uniref:TetR/AcrR family transcriptional regulator n=1 Tax=Nocardioides sp. TaxID=35761 RepID=UPI0039E4B2DB
MQETRVRRRAGRSKGDQREDRILDATRELLAGKSMAAVTIDDIAAAAGISRTTFYFYFPGKQAVLARLMEQVGDRFAQTHGWLASEGPSPAQLGEQLAGAAALWRENRPIMACSLAGFGDDYPPLVAFLAETQQRFVSGLAAKIERDRAAGLAPAGIGAHTLAGMVEAMREARLAELAELPASATDEGLEELVEAVLRLIYGRW